MFTRPPMLSNLKIPPYVWLGALIILLPIVFFISYQSITRQQTNTQLLLLEKGAALIRSFEAGTRVGMRGQQWGHRRLQQLLVETALQPDIAYLMVTDDKGVILAHNQTDKIGTVYGTGLGLDTVVSKPLLYWRILDVGRSERIFEVYRRFIPTGIPGNPNAERMMRGYMRHAPPFVPRINDNEAKQVIFVGLNMQSLDEAGRSTLLNSLVTGVLLLLAGSAGIVLLFLFQTYRSTKTSLVRIKAFSDNLVNNMPIGLVALDADKVITSVNATGEEILGNKATNIMGKAASTVLPAALLESISAIDKTGRIIGQELEGVLRDDKTIPMEISMSSIKDETGKLLGYALLMKDLSEIFHLKKEVARSQRLASVGRLAAGVAHEIRNPLSSIKGFATYFRDRHQEVEKDRHIATIMINEVERLDRVVGQLLELSRPVQIIPQATAIGPFLTESVRLIERKLEEKKITLVREPDGQACELYLDRDRINQVLLNLYLNAIEAMTAEGILKVGYRCDPVTDSVAIMISDTGKGIAEQDLTKIFDPYFTTKPTGTGLGLAIVHNILEAHRGKIHVASQPGQGTTFTVTIPNLKPEPKHDR